MLEKGWNPRLQEDTLRTDLINIHPTASIFKKILDKVKDLSKQRINDAFDYEKQKWDNSRKVPDFKVGNLALVLTLNFDNRIDKVMAVLRSDSHLLSYTALPWDNIP
ncbi:hypothetical protein O181_129183 [Austropuccinia psidii MF-1]|uniref:Uncharacterized protein n=1 Tax=Austropuccinia psidii MF-1 TaxID=1389203 RepID=A0A9Q3KWA6_9BASI|nr:hypothetical protein [Austropuccinia psidii MF-1]